MNTSKVKNVGNYNNKVWFWKLKLIYDPHIKTSAKNIRNS